MKKQFLFLLFCILVSLNTKAQSSISFTTLPTTVEAGTILTVNYKYTVGVNVTISCGVNLQDNWTWLSYINGQSTTAALGTNLTGAFSFLIPTGTIPSNNLANALNYKILIEMKNTATGAWIAGAYPPTPLQITKGPFVYENGRISLWPSLNNGVGLGVLSAKSKLDVEGNLTVGSTYAGNNAAPVNGAIIEGNVGIGTLTTGSHKLAVEGTIGAREVKVYLGAWSDFVFKKDYNLPTLKEVETHIRSKGHLKGIPSEKEVIQNGVNLGEMNSKLLQKVEELTLYLIQQNKDIEVLKEENEKYKSLVERVTALEKK